MTYCVISRQSRSEVKSLANVLDMLSTWMLKSPVKITVGDIAQSDVSSDENSVKNTADDFGGL